ncbi:sulfurtransferase complex subunit TusD [Buchnera aphidicola (Taiwanaphis decaspermi)]|uniref:sulfurtransferase complex subunit TusD n=1 Tax=Buchnera aphidicola TaxID=9 RepID=UPI0031B87F5A
MHTFSIIVSGPPYGTQNSSTAFLFAKTLLSSKNKIYGVFFFADGVQNSNFFVKSSNDEYNLVNKWYKLSNKFGFKLNVCASACMRRGILSYLDNKKKKNINNFHHGFKFIGSMALSFFIINSDRIIQF